MSIFSKKYQSLPMSKAMIEVNKNKSIILLDVRTKEEYATGRIPKAINIPLDSIEQVTKKIPNKEASIYVYCLSGGRSMQASVALSQMGYTNITNIGGIMSYNGQVER